MIPSSTPLETRESTESNGQVAMSNYRHSACSNVEWLNSATKTIANFIQHASFAALTLLVANAVAQPPDTYRMYTSKEEPGIIGKRQVAHGRVPAGLVQPVKVIAPAGTLVSPANGGSYNDDHFAPVEFGLRVGEIYRFRLTDIPRLGNKEIYPSVEMIGHLHPPEGKSRDFPVPVVFTIEDLRIAADGGLVTRVVYVEDPDGALPGMLDAKDQSYFEVSRGEDPLHIAEVLGRPVAILRIGSKSPDPSGVDHNFAFQSPAVERYSGNRRTLSSDLLGANSRSRPSKSRGNEVLRASYNSQPPRTNSAGAKNKPAPIRDAKNVRKRRPLRRDGDARMPVPFAPASPQLIRTSQQ